VLALGLIAACATPLASVAPSISSRESPSPSTSVAESALPILPTPLSSPVIASPPPPASAWRAVPIALRGRIGDIIRLSDGSYLAVGASGWNGAIWRSADGLSWVEVADVPPIGPEDAKGLSGVIETATGYLAWGGGGARYSEGYFSVIWTSSDGAEWIERARWTGFAFDVAEGGPGFVAVGSKAGLDNLFGALAWSSADGISWTDSPPVPGAGGTGMLGVIPVEGGFLAVGASRDQVGVVDGMVWRSDDGIAWRQIQDGTLAGSGLSEVILTHGRLVAAGWTPLHTTTYGDLDQTGIWISNDGSTWTQPYAPECCGQMLDIVDTGSGLLALYRWYVPEGSDGFGLLWSTDGTSWDVIGAPSVEEGVFWLGLRNLGGTLGVVGLALRDVGNGEVQPVLLVPPPGLISQ